jgi:AcrR family transcriptional regulator
MTTRDPDKTRATLLEAAAGEMYQVGFQAASLDRILRSAGVTKGALYHHFRGKLELGYAVVDEVIAKEIRERWVQPLGRGGDPIELIKRTLQTNAEWAAETGMLAKGCPLNNLAQEMSPLDEGFRSRIQTVFCAWRDAFAYALHRGQEEGSVRPDIDPDETGLFILATLEGVTGIVKNHPSPELAMRQMGTFFLFLDSLRTTTPRAA